MASRFRFSHPPPQFAGKIAIVDRDGGVAPQQRTDESMRAHASREASAGGAARGGGVVASLSRQPSSASASVGPRPPSALSEGSDAGLVYLPRAQPAAAPSSYAPARDDRGYGDGDEAGEDGYGDSGDDDGLLVLPPGPHRSATPLHLAAQELRSQSRGSTFQPPGSRGSQRGDASPAAISPTTGGRPPRVPSASHLHHNAVPAAASLPSVMTQPGFSGAIVSGGHTRVGLASSLASSSSLPLSRGGSGGGGGGGGAPALGRPFASVGGGSSGGGVKSRLGVDALAALLSTTDDPPAPHAPPAAPAPTTVGGLNVSAISGIHPFPADTSAVAIAVAPPSRQPQSYPSALRSVSPIDVAASSSPRAGAGAPLAPKPAAAAAAASAASAARTSRGSRGGGGTMPEGSYASSSSSSSRQVPQRAPSSGTGTGSITSSAGDSGAFAPGAFDGQRTPLRTPDDLAQSDGSGRRRVPLPSYDDLAGEPEPEVSPLPRAAPASAADEGGAGKSRTRLGLRQQPRGAASSPPGALPSPPNHHQQPQQPDLAELRRRPTKIPSPSPARARAAVPPAPAFAPPPAPSPSGYGDDDDVDNGDGAGDLGPDMDVDAATTRRSTGTSLPHPAAANAAKPRRGVGAGQLARMRPVGGGLLPVRSSAPAAAGGLFSKLQQQQQQQGEGGAAAPLLGRRAGKGAGAASGGAGLPTGPDGAAAPFDAHQAARGLSPRPDHRSSYIHVDHGGPRVAEALNALLVHSDEDKLAYSRKARAVNFTPHTIADYRAARGALGMGIGSGGAGGGDGGGKGGGGRGGPGGGLSSPADGYAALYSGGAAPPVDTIGIRGRKGAPAGYYELGTLGPDLGAEETVAAKAARDRQVAYAQSVAAQTRMKLAAGAAKRAERDRMQVQVAALAGEGDGGDGEGAGGGDGYGEGAAGAGGRRAVNPPSPDALTKHVVAVAGPSASGTIRSSLAHRDPAIEARQRAQEARDRTLEYAKQLPRPAVRPAAVAAAAAAPAPSMTASRSDPEAAGGGLGRVPARRGYPQTDVSGIAPHPPMRSPGGGLLWDGDRPSKPLSPSPAVLVPAELAPAAGRRAAGRRANNGGGRGAAAASSVSENNLEAEHERLREEADAIRRELAML
jgi:hypothetical protein